MSACIDPMNVCILDIELMYEIHISLVVCNYKDRFDHRKLILLNLMLVYGYMFRPKDVMCSKYRSLVWEFRSRGGMSLQRQTCL